MQVRELKLSLAPNPSQVKKSHLMQVRELKLFQLPVPCWSESLSHLMQVRELKHHDIHRRQEVFPSHLMQVRELKQIQNLQSIHQNCRTSCRCVN